MDAQTFLDNFATLADAPGGVQRLRDLLLGLAVSGRLVEQDPNEDPATALLEQIRADMDRLCADGRARPNQPHAPREPNGALPAGWCWAYVPQLGFVNPRNHVSGDPLAGFVPMPLVPTDARESVRYEERKWSEISKGYTHIADGDVAVAKITPCFQNRKSAVIAGLPAGTGAATTELFVVRPTEGGANRRYLHLFFRSPGYIGGGVPEMTGTAGQQRLPRQYFTDTPVPLPPLAEQERIVAKVDELMGLCDDLEARQEHRHRAATRFRASALHALTEAKTPADLRLTWERVSTNWPAVTLNAEDIRSLKATVLQLAVEGRLVSRLPQEGTADQTLSAVNDERTRLVSEGAIPRPKPSVEVTADEQPYELPEHWRWIHVEDIVTHIVDCLHRTPPYTDAGIPAIRTSDVEPGQLLLDQALLVDEATYREQTRRLVPQEGDVLYSREGGRFGIAAVIPADTKLCLSQRMMQFRCAAAVSPDYFSWFLNSPLGFGQAAEDVGGSASPHVNIKSIRRFILPLPPSGEQLRIVDAISRMLEAIEHLATSVQRQEEHASRFADSAASAFTSRPARSTTPS